MKITFTTQELNLIQFIKACAQETGTTVRICGGYVRDKLLGLESSDIDIAVDNMSGLAFAEICNSKQDKRNISVIEARPEQSKHLETARLNVLGFDIDFCALRKETYADSRIPNSEPGTPQEDASRRDLTINALFYNINTDEIEDFVGGIDDLNNKIARTPLESKQTFLDDPLRILRTIRFCAKYDLKLDISLESAACDKEVQNAFVSKISKERVLQECIGYYIGEKWKPGFLSGKNAHIAYNMVDNFGFKRILYNHYRYIYKSIEHIEKHSGLVDENKAIVNLALVLARHSLTAQKDLENAVFVLDSLQCSNKFKNIVLDLLKHQLCFQNTKNPSDKELRTALRNLGNYWYLSLLFSEALEINDAYPNVGHVLNKYLHLRNKMLVLLREQGNKTSIQRPINGTEIQQITMQKGPIIGEIFKAIDELLLENPHLSKQECIEFIEKNFRR